MSKLLDFTVSDKEKYLLLSSTHEYSSSKEKEELNCSVKLEKFVSHEEAMGGAPPKVLLTITSSEIDYTDIKREQIFADKISLIISNVKEYNEVLNFFASIQENEYKLLNMHCEVVDDGRIGIYLYSGAMHSNGLLDPLFMPHIVNYIAINKVKFFP